MKMVSMSLAAVLFTYLHIYMVNRVDAKPSSYNKDLSVGGTITTYNENEQELPSADRIQKRSADDYEYDDYEDDLYLDYEEETDEYVDEQESPRLDEALLAKLLRPPDLPLAETSFNRSLNLRVPSRDAPEYMLALYDKFSKNKWAHPKSNIVRSFQNINEDISSANGGGGQLDGAKTRYHILVFNITSISEEEEIDLAQIRLYKLVERDRNTYIGVDRKVSVFEVFYGDSNEGEMKHRIISLKHIYGRNSGWEAFDVTLAVRRWVRFVNSVQILEIRIESVFPSVSSGDMDIDTTHKNKKDPLLVVFSSYANKKRLHAQELRELISHEEDVDSETINLAPMFSTNQKPDTISLNPSSNINLMISNYSPALRRVKRARRIRKTRNSCRRKAMYVDFASINWDGWIIYPQGYQAFECTGKCHFPLSDHLTPTKHAIIQTLVHTNNPKKASKACCVPTKLDPVSILYVDQHDVVTYEYKYAGMVVAECGCR